MKHSILFLVIIIISSIVYSQEKDSLISEIYNETDDTKYYDEEYIDHFNLPVSIHPAPTSAGMVNSISTNIDLYTGKLNVELPLYNLKSRDIEVPIGLSYSRNGIKVDEVAGWVGLGWNLNAGGTITRVMNGLPDEFEGEVDLMHIGGDNKNDAYGYLHLKDEGVKQKVELEKFHSDFSNREKEKIIERADWMSLTRDKDVFDTKPDEFYFNFGTYSGKFVFNQEGEVLQLSRQALRITYEKSDGKIVLFTIVTPDGYKYTFGDTNYESVEESSFHLKKYNVSFLYKCTYQEVDENWLGNPKSSDMYYDVIPYVTNGINYSNYYYINNFESPTYTSTWYLKKIESPSGDIVTFSYITPKEEITYVSSIEENISMPRFTLKTNDYEEDANCKYQWYLHCKKLYCNQLDFYSGSPSIREFEGHKLNLSITKTTVKHNIRKLKEITTSAGNKAEFELKEEDREDLLNDNSLAEIIISEGNEELKFNFIYFYMKPTSFDTDGIVYNLGPAVSRKQVSLGWEYEFTDRYETDKYLKLGIMQNNEEYRANQMRLILKEVYQSSSDYIETYPPYEFKYYGSILPARLSYLRNYGGYCSYQSQPTKIPTISFTDKNDLFIREGEIISSENWDCSPGVHLNFRPYGIENMAMTGCNENAGTMHGYSLKEIVYPTGGRKTIAYSNNTTGDGTNVPGLCVIKLTDVPVQGEGIIQSYSYEGGALAGDRVMGYTLDIDMGANARVQFGSSNIAGSFLTKGNYVGYEKVEVSKELLGKTVYTFINPATIMFTDYSFANEPTPVYIIGESVSNDNVFPYPPALDNDWQRGLIRSIEILDNSGGKLKTIEYEYNLPPNNDFSEYSYGLTAARYQKIFKNNGERLGSPEFIHKAGLYKYESNFLFKTKERITDYNPASPGSLSNAIITDTDYDYDHYLLQINKITKHFDDGSKYEKIMRYPTDIHSEWKGKSDSAFKTGDVINPYFGLNYQCQNHIYQPNEIIEKINNKIISGSFSTFQVTSENNLLPYQSFSLKINKPLESPYFFSETVGTRLYWDQKYGDPDLTVTKYDEYNRITEIENEFGISSSYIWSDLNLPMIASADYAGENEIGFTSFEELDIGSAPSVHGCWRINVGTIRDDEAYTGGKSFSGAMHLNTDFVTNLSDDKVYMLSYQKKEPNSDWIHVTEEFTKSEGASIVCSSSNVRIDEVRVQPFDAKMMTYTHKPIAGPTSITDANLNTELYEYDGLYRLKTIKDQYGKFVKLIDYTYIVFDAPKISEIIGPQSVILGQTYTYEVSLASLPGVQEFHWSVQNGTILSQDFNKVSIKFDNSSSHKVSVYASSDAWNNDTETKELQITELYIPAPIIEAETNVTTSPFGNFYVFYIYLPGGVPYDYISCGFYDSNDNRIPNNEDSWIQYDYNYPRMAVYFYTATQTQIVTLKAVCLLSRSLV
jgi:hypothetical protein